MVNFCAINHLIFVLQWSKQNWTNWHIHYEPPYLHDQQHMVLIPTYQFSVNYIKYYCYEETTLGFTKKNYNHYKPQSIKSRPLIFFLWIFWEKKLNYAFFSFPYMMISVTIIVFSVSGNQKIIPIKVQLTTKYTVKHLYSTNNLENKSVLAIAKSFDFFLFLIFIVKLFYCNLMSNVYSNATFNSYQFNFQYFNL